MRLDDTAAANGIFADVRGLEGGLARAKWDAAFGSGCAEVSSSLPRSAIVARRSNKPYGCLNTGVLRGGAASWLPSSLEVLRVS
jgi:hypothetical protein